MLLLAMHCPGPQSIAMESTCYRATLPALSNTLLAYSVRETVQANKNKWCSTVRSDVVAREAEHVHLELAECVWCIQRGIVC